VGTAADQLGVDGLDLVVGGDTEVIAQASPQRLVDEQGLGNVAARGEDLHQKAMAALSIRCLRRQRTRGTLGKVELRPAEAESGRGKRCQRRCETDPSVVWIAI
jgi:hypothetical protein